MRTLDTTRLNKGQLEILRFILEAMDKNPPAESLGQRMRMSNLNEHPL